MQTTYFSSFLLGATPSDTPSSFDVITPYVEHWIFNEKRKFSRPKEFAFDRDGDYPLGGDAVVRVRKVDNDGDGRKILAIRFEHPDSGLGEKRRWYSDCVLTTTLNFDRLRMSTRVAVMSPAENYSPVGAPLSTPRIVPELITRLGAREQYKMKSIQININDSDVDMYYNWLVDSERRLPIVFVSLEGSSLSPLVDVEFLANQLAGVAHVCLASTSEVTWLMREKMDNFLNAYNGAIRVYWPGFVDSDTPRKHKLWPPTEIETSTSSKAKLGDRTINAIRKYIMDFTALRHFDVPTRWEDVERTVSQLALRSLKDQGKDEEAIKGAHEILKLYEADKNEAERKLEQLGQDFDDARAREESLNDQVERWESLVKTLSEEYNCDFRDLAVRRHKPDTVSEALDIIERTYKDRIVVPSGRIKSEADNFENVKDLFAALQWLVTTYWESKVGRKSVGDPNASCREASGFSFSANQSESSMGLRPEDYNLTVDGIHYVAKAHIGKGTSTNSRYSIRVAFDYDEKKKKFFVGYVGQHQTSKRTN